MKIVGFDTTAPILTVGLSENGVSVGRWDERVARARGNMLEALIDRALSEAGWQRNAVNGLSLVTGPGSLTATRIGWATASGWAMALDIPVTGWPTAAVQRRYWLMQTGRSRYDAMQGCDTILALVHHRGNEFYSYDLKSDHDQLPQVMQLDKGPISSSGRIWLAGPGLIGHRERWQTEYVAHNAEAQLVYESDAIVGGDLLAQWGTEDFEAGRSLSLADSPLDYGLPPDFKKQKK